MRHSTKRLLIALLAVAVVGTIASIAGYDGPLTPVDPDIDITIHGSRDWYARPEIVTRTTDPDSIYVIVPAMPDGREFAAVRVSSTTGAQTPVKIELGPTSGTRPHLLDSDVRAVIHGLRFRRPGFYLMRLPDGKGPGFQTTDSATGRIDIVFDRAGRTRRLLTRRAYNSDRIAELLSIVSVDPGGRWIAATRHDPTAGWRLFVFRVR
ncbi:MAG TPA: hypothetical protein VEL79_09705 [Vicinamibacterales bacterium]|nr:hypothetical protein [Vicinamibacterales bacterium]